MCPRAWVHFHRHTTTVRHTCVVSLNSTVRARYRTALSNVTSLVDDRACCGLYRSKSPPPATQSKATSLRYIGLSLYLVMLVSLRKTPVRCSVCNLVSTSSPCSKVFKERSAADEHMIIRTTINATKPQRTRSRISRKAEIDSVLLVAWSFCRCS